MLTQKRLKEIFSYSCETGLFTRVSRTRGISNAVGKTLNVNHSYGYVTTRIDGKLYYAHRLVFLYLFGEMPPDGMTVDHINGNKSDNRKINLRVATQSQNRQNIRSALTGSSHGFLGVHFCKTTKMYRAQIRFNNKKVHIGRYLTKEEAHNAYLNKKRDIHEFCTI